MEIDAQKEQQREQIRREKYLIGQRCTNSAAFNPLSGTYEQSERGLMLKQAEKDRDVRAAIRNRNIELNTNATYDVINGLPRIVTVVPQHDVYNPVDYQKHNDLAGRPTRANSNMQFAVSSSPTVK
jgi:hypothetical protein